MIHFLLRLEYSAISFQSENTLLISIDYFLKSVVFSSPERFELLHNSPLWVIILGLDSTKTAAESNFIEQTRRHFFRFLHQSNQIQYYFKAAAMKIY